MVEKQEADASSQSEPSLDSPPIRNKLQINETDYQEESVRFNPFSPKLEDAYQSNYSSQREGREYNNLTLVS